MAGTLAQHRDARDRLLARVTSVLEADARVAAAWLSGSYGRGEADEWSDLDLHVTVADDHLAAFLDGHESLFASCGSPLLSFGDGMFSNSMPGGRFWLVQYAPHMLEIDWNIGPMGGTTRPEASHVLFDRVGIPVTPPLLSVDEGFRRKEARTQLHFFWAMAPIAIKFVGRGHTRLAVKQVDYLEGAFVKLWRALWQPELLQKDVFHQNRPLEAELDGRVHRFGVTIDPLEALAVIRHFCHEVEQLHPALAELGVCVHDDVVSEVAARAGGSNPNRGSRR